MCLFFLEISHHKNSHSVLLKYLFCSIFYQTLTELEKRQKQIEEREGELQRNSKNLAAEYDRKMIELREASRRVKENYEHQLNLERARYDDLQQRFEKQNNEIRRLEEKVKDRENEVYSLKESMVKRPEVKMQSDMNLLLIEKVFLSIFF